MTDLNRNRHFADPCLPEMLFCDGSPPRWMCQSCFRYQESSQHKPLTESWQQCWIFLVLENGVFQHLREPGAEVCSEEVKK